MSLGDDLIVTARRLARANPSKPRQADLRRSISTAYYAIFHTLAHQCADLLIGVGTARNDPAWTQVYRSLEHGFAKNACKQAEDLGFPPQIVTFADSFVLMQEERHRVDYDPEARYSRAQTLFIIADTTQAQFALNQAGRQDRRAFAAHVLLKRR